jgi:hypothetical protein
MRALAALLGASALLGGCIGVPPAVNPTVDVWNVQPAADADVVDVIVEEVISLATSALDDSSAAASNNDHSCWFRCFHQNRARPARSASHPVAAAPVVYQYTTYSEPRRPVTRSSNTTHAPVMKPTPRPVQVAAPKPAAPKPAKPAVAPKSTHKKQDKK